MFSFFASGRTLSKRLNVTNPPLLHIHSQSQEISWYSTTQYTSSVIGIFPCPVSGCPIPIDPYYFRVHSRYSLYNCPFLDDSYDGRNFYQNMSNSSLSGTCQLNVTNRWRLRLVAVVLAFSHADFFLYATPVIHFQILAIEIQVDASEPQPPSL